MRIGELAEATGASPRSLRHYEEHGLIGARRDSNGYRQFEPGTVVTVHHIQELLALGLNVRKVRELLPCMRDDMTCDEARRVVNDQLARLDSQIERLNRQRSGLLAYA